MTVELRVQPRARRTLLTCPTGAGLKAAVTAPADDGRANRAVVELLAAEWRLAKSAFEITRGTAARDKVLSISGEPDLLATRIAQWLEERTQADD